MINLADIDSVKAIQSNLRTLPIGDKENMKVMEELCGWVDFNDTEPNIVLIKNGKRSILATIKTLLECTPDQIVALTRSE